MTIKVGINGFGRIGRMVFRAVYDEAEFNDIEIVGINDLLDAEYLAYMLKYDSVHGRFNGEVSSEDGALIVDGRKIRLTAERDPADLKWSDVSADLVIDSTGFFLTEESCQKHIDAGAKKVVQSAHLRMELQCSYMVLTIMNMQVRLLSLQHLVLLTVLLQLRRF